MRAANTTLGEQLDAMHSLDSPKQQSLLNEMECDDGFHSSAYSSVRLPFFFGHNNGHQLIFK